MSILPYETLILEIPVTAENTLPNESTLPNHASVRGGDTQGTSEAVSGASLTTGGADQQPARHVRPGTRRAVAAPRRRRRHDRHQRGHPPVPADQHRRVQPDARGSPGTGARTDPLSPVRPRCPRISASSCPPACSATSPPRHAAATPSSPRSRSATSARPNRPSAWQA